MFKRYTQYNQYLDFFESTSKFKKQVKISKNINKFDVIDIAKNTKILILILIVYSSEDLVIYLLPWFSASRFQPVFI